MKKMKLKTRIQWGWFEAALFGACIAFLIMPILGHPMKEMDMELIHWGTKVKVIINGDVVALARSKEEGMEAYKQARLAYNADGVNVLLVDVEYEEVDKKRDADLIKGKSVLRQEALTSQILTSFERYAEPEKEKAYTMRIDDYTVTVDSMESAVAILERAQGQYDTEDSFQVDLAVPKSGNVTMYEVGITPKDIQKSEKDKTIEQSEKKEDSENISDPSTDLDATETAKDDLEQSNQETSQMEMQSADDGIKYIGFAEKIQVMQTYVKKEQIVNQEDAFVQLTKQEGEPGIYVVEPGDYLERIAEKNNMTVAEIKELNPGIESDENLYYDDRLNVTVPTAPVQILVQKRETYEERYYADVVYEDDPDLYIGETEIVQEGTEGKHIVTDLVTYKNDMESSREEMEETIEVAAIAQIVKRGTKSKPTYMYPMTNWNVTSNYGYRWGRLHAGTDVGVPVGTTVRASRSGKVVTAGWVGGYGNCVMIDHGDGVWTVYGHLSEITTSVGNYVNQGDQIALSGNTGRSTGPHLHFEVRVNGSAVDATPYLNGTATQ